MFSTTGRRLGPILRSKSTLAPSSLTRNKLKEALRSLVAEHKDGAPLYAVILTVFGGAILATGVISRQGTKIALLQQQIATVREEADLKVKIAMAEAREGKAQAMEAAHEKFLVYGYAEEYQRYRDARKGLRTGLPATAVENASADKD